MARNTKNADIIVIGAGIAGLSTAFHLSQLYQIRSVMIFAGSHQPASLQAAGWVSGGQVDNFTRISYVHGPRAAKPLWQFGDRAAEQLFKFCHTHQIPYERNHRTRLLVSEHEHEEALTAVDEMNSVGLGVSLQPPQAFLQDRTLACQVDQTAGGFVDANKLIAALQQQCNVSMHNTDVIKLHSEKGSPTVIDSRDDQFSSQIVVLTPHLGIRALLPQLAEAFVPVAEQWIEVQFASPMNIPVGFTFSANHGYEWGVFTSPNVCRIGGGRFLRKLAGIGWEQAPIDDKITSFLRQQLEKTFVDLNVLKITSVVAGLDCRPCDEMPIVGPMFGDDRLLIAGGFMGLGLSQGFYAGECLAELIASGRSAQLPRMIFPERLRTIT